MRKGDLARQCWQWEIGYIDTGGIDPVSRYIEDNEI